MGNARRFRRKIHQVNGVPVLQTGPDDRPGADQTEGTPGPGAINGYNCTTCHKVTLVIHRDAGVTPMFLACTNPECNGTGESLMYPNQDAIPPRIREKVRWEWYRPSKKEFKKLSSEMQDHVKRGGLVLREYKR